MQHRLVQTAIALATAGTLHAGTTAEAAGAKNPAPASQASDTSAYDDIWDALSLYKSDSGFVNEFRVIGRYHGQIHLAEGEGDADSSFWEHRRMRAGFRVSMLEKELTLNAEYQWNDLPAQYDSEMTDVYLEYKPKKDGINFRIGKWQPHFGYEFGTTSREIITFERTAFVNSLGINFTPGVRVGGKHGKFSWSLAGFSNLTDEYYGSFDGGASVLATVGYDISEVTGWDKSDLRLDYFHSDHEAGDNRLAGFDDAVSLSFQGKKGAVGLNTDVILSQGSSGDVVHLMLMPTYDITEKLQGVLRYSYSTGSESDTLRPLRRYESFLDAPRGDEYHSVYLGLNYYLYGHKLKLMTGVEYSHMDGEKDADSFTAYSGIRMYF